MVNPDFIFAGTHRLSYLRDRILSNGKLSVNFLLVK